LFPARRQLHLFLRLVPESAITSAAAPWVLGSLFPARRQLHLFLRLVPESAITSAAAPWVLVPGAPTTPFDFPSCSRKDTKLPPRCLVRVWKTPEENAAHSPRAFPLGVAAPVGAPHVKSRCRRKARGRRPRQRSCLRKGCNRQYLPRRWNQRYCHDPECQREVRRWQAARRQAEHRKKFAARQRHAQAERERRQRAKAAPKTVENVDLAPARGHAAEKFFPLHFATGPAVMKRP
jgi:hypothetical protein